MRYEGWDSGFFLGVENPERARLGAFGGMPTDLLGQIAQIEVDEVNDMAGRAVSPDKFAFTAVGPMFEEDIDQFDLR